MESYFNTIFEDARHEQSLISLLSLVEPDILKQSKCTYHEIDFIRNLALQKITSTAQSERDNRFRLNRKAIF